MFPESCEEKPYYFHLLVLSLLKPRYMCNYFLNYDQNNVHSKNSGTIYI